MVRILWKENFSYICTAFKQGTIAQLVEHRTENPGVPGSIPGGTTTLGDSLQGFFYGEFLVIG